MALMTYQQMLESHNQIEKELLPFGFYYSYNTRIVSSLNFESHEQIARFVSLKIIDNNLKFSDIIRHAKEAEFIKELNAQLFFYSQRTKDLNKWFEHTKRIVKKVITDIHFLYAFNEWLKEKEEAQKVKTNESKLSFTKEKLRPIILELAESNGYQDPVTFLDELLERVKTFEDFNFTNDFYLNINYLCNEYKEKFWSESHRKAITRWLKKAPIITTLFDKTWIKDNYSLDEIYQIYHSIDVTKDFLNNKVKVSITTTKEQQDEYYSKTLIRTLTLFLEQYKAHTNKLNDKLKREHIQGLLNQPKSPAKVVKNFREGDIYQYEMAAKELFEKFLTAELHKVTDVQMVQVKPNNKEDSKIYNTHIFSSEKGFLFFEALRQKLVRKRYPLADFSFIYWHLLKDKFINKISPTDFRTYISDNFQIELDKLKTKSNSETEAKNQAYQSLREQFQ